MTKSVLPYLFHIRDSINYIQEYLTGLTFDTFKKDHKTWDAIVKQIENIGEEVNKIEVGFRNSIPDIPWSQMAATRNKLAHDYWDINPKRVWEIATIDIPKLKQQLLPILKELEAQEKPSTHQ